jgi:hypothetical protein
LGGRGVMGSKMGDEYSNLSVTEVKCIIGKQSRSKRKHYSKKKIATICNEPR